MKAIGLIVKPTEHTGSFGDAWNHVSFLKEELKKHMSLLPKTTNDLSRYNNLVNYYASHQLRENEHEENKKDRTIHGPTVSDSHYNHSVNYNLRMMLSNNEEHGNYDSLFSIDSSFSDFAQQLGPNLFVLWKAALLRKTIVLLSMPPMESTCKYVYNIHLIGKIPVEFQVNNVNDINPLFTVGVNDIPQLEKMNKQSYIACTPDSIFQTKLDLYDLLITLPQQEVAHDQKKIKFKSISMATEHNPADLTRYKILWTLLSTNVPWAQIVSEEPKDAYSMMSALLTGACYWLYEENDVSQYSSFMPSIRNYNWQDLFVGADNRRGRLRLFEDNRLLLIGDEEEEDATEINHEDIYHTLTNSGTVTTEKKNEIILRFFHNLNYFLLSKLQSILSMREENEANNHLIMLYPKDMIQLGLDPQHDASFIIELSQLYFKKRVQVFGWRHLCYTRSCCCC
ncbi:MAG: hypothetical protein EXX96DRAFT_24410 [Benjaminiella poitrasii]|nr:MAG: hypothetical protein EXX96DRAFT_24410 [Benjaminiella poitrasii]